MNVRAVVVIAIALACTGCAEAALPSSAPTQSADRSGPPSLSELVVSPEGLGSLVIGQAPPTADPTSDILVYDPQACAWAAEENPHFSRDTVAMWVANYNDDGHPGESDPFGVDITDGAVSIISINSEEIATARGIHRGMTRDELLAAYPTGLEFETEGQGIDAYRLRGTAGDLVFTLWEFDDPESWRIAWINVGTHGFEVPLYGTDSWGWWAVCNPA